MKKIESVMVCMLMILSSMAIILHPDNETVKASGGEPTGNGVGLDNDFIVNISKNISQVIYHANWNGSENHIPKGRSWATAGENYTISHILKPNMNGADKVCGLTGYQEILIQNVTGPRGLIPYSKIIRKEYSSKINITDYSLSLYNNGIFYKNLSYSECFPFGRGITPNLITCSSFNNSSINDLNGALDNINHHYINVSATILNNYTNVFGLAYYINNNRTLPLIQDYNVFIINETPSCEDIIKNISVNAGGCILIANKTGQYSFTNASNQTFPVVRVNGSSSNLSSVLSEIEKGFYYTVDDFASDTSLSFLNISALPYSDYNHDWVGVINLNNESDNFSFF